jgi:ubiquinone/menaquinone biosynthesis C-methylase UbiE
VQDPIFGFAPGLHPLVRKLRVQRWYKAVSSALGTDPRWLFSNYGYAWQPADMHRPELSEPEEVARPYLSLYRRTLLGVDLQGREVLEVGAGRGGGAMHLSRLGTKSYVAVEASPDSVAFAKSVDPSGVEWLEGMAERLPVPDERFDVLLSVEAVHAFASEERFAAEAARALRDEAQLRIADFRPGAQLDRFASVLAASSFEQITREDISAGVREALSSQQKRLAEYVKNHPNDPNTPVLREFLGLAGSVFFDQLGSGVLRYEVIGAQRARRAKKARKRPRPGR